MTLEEWNTALRVASVVVIGVTFLIAAGALWTSYLVNQRQEERIAAIGNDAATANLKAAQINERAEQLALENVTLRAALADRTLSPEQQHNVALALKAVPRPNVTVWTRSDRGNTEAERLGKDIEAALRLAGLKTEIRNDGYSNMTRPIEVQCGGTDREFAHALISALMNAGGLSVTPLSELGCGASDNAPEILIGLKPAIEPRRH